MELKLPIAWVFLGLFVALSIVQIIFCFFEKENLRKITKPFCVLFLGIFACLACPDRPFIYIGAFLGCLGDAFLIRNKETKFFIPGSLLFMAGHVFYFLELAQCLSFEIKWYWYLVVPISLALTMLLLYPITGKMFGRIALIGNVYMPMLLLGALLGVMLATDNPVKWPGFMYTMGYVFFLVSDCALTIATFKKDYKRRDFYIMLTYLVAEFLIVFALVGANVIA